MKFFKRVVLSLAVIVLMITVSSKDVEAATAAQKEAVANEIRTMLYSADASVHNISKYYLTTSELNQIYDKLKREDCRWIIAAYYSNMDLDYNSFWGWVRTIQFTNVDADVLNRYEDLSKNVPRILSGIKSDMTDLDKIIYLHDALIDLVTYRFEGYQSYGAGGALGDEVAVCSGYTKALNLLLDYVGIETTYVSSEAINHAWTYVKLDGQWYHMDSTWDDTRSGKNGVTGHRFMLRNDAEFVIEGNKDSHVSWVTKNVDVKSTSNRFSDWYVHDIVGKMCYQDGYWYYVDKKTNSIMKNTAIGDCETAVMSGIDKGEVTLVSVSGDIVTYKISGATYTYDMSAPLVEEPKEEEQKVESSVEENVSPVIMNLEQISLNDFANWQSGVYSWIDGTLMTDSKRICLKDYVTFTGTTYTAKISDANYHILVRELDKDKQFLTTYNLANGDSFTVLDETEYLAISLYNFTSEKGMKYSVWQKSFQNGLTLELVGANVSVQEEPISEELKNGEPAEEETPIEEPVYDETEEVENVEKEEEVAPFNYSDINNWRSGLYHWDDGKYVTNTKRICLNDYIEANATSYVAYSSDTNIHILVRELDENYNMLASYNLSSGDSFTVNPSTKYLAVSLYKFDSEKSLKYSKWVNMFKGGLKIDLIGK